MSTWKTEYKAISKNGIGYFNDELKKHIDEGYIPFGGISVHTGDTDDAYSVLLSRTVEIHETNQK